MINLSCEGGQLKQNHPKSRWQVALCGKQKAGNRHEWHLVKALFSVPGSFMWQVGERFPDATLSGLAVFLVTQGRPASVGPTLGCIMERRWRYEPSRDCGGLQGTDTLPTVLSHAPSLLPTLPLRSRHLSEILPRSTLRSMFAK